MYSFEYEIIKNIDKSFKDYQQKQLKQKTEYQVVKDNKRICENKDKSLTKRPYS